MSEILQKLNILYDLLVDNYAPLEDELIELIYNPGKIEDTNKFASLLSKLNSSEFINPLLKQISVANKDDSWLSDYLYAVIQLLEESSVNEEFNFPENLIDKLEEWIINNNGELSWKAANVLKFYESESAERVQLKKLEGYDDFFLTYVECILGLLHYNKDKHLELVERISKDSARDEELRKFCEDAITSYRS